MRIIGNIVIFGLVLWALAASVSSFFGVTVIFPWNISETGEVPRHRSEALRIGLFLTFAYYGIVHLLNKSRALLPVNFLTTFLFYMVLSGLIVYYRDGAALHQYTTVAFFALCCLACFFVSRPSVRRMFAKK